MPTYYARQILGEEPIYSGHPVTLALLIVSRFESLAEAKEAALSSLDIPGAGSSVQYALDLLTMARDPEVGWDLALAHAVELWERGETPGEHVGAARAQADKFHPRLLAALKNWS